MTEAAPRFLELKRMAPKIRHEYPACASIMRDVIEAPCIVVDDVRNTAGWLEAAQQAWLAGEVPLPFPITMFECWVSWGHLVLLVKERAKGWIIMPFVIRSDGRWGLPRDVVTLKRGELKGEIACATDEDWRTLQDSPLAIEQYTVTAELVRVFAWLVACGLVRSEARSVGATTKALMQAKGLKGWQYRLVTIEPRPAPARAELGGTHASPRWHLRRAHVRRLKGGKVVAVRSCEVGTAEHGGVVKDYELPPSSLLPA